MQICFVTVLLESQQVSIFLKINPSPVKWYTIRGSNRKDTAQSNSTSSRCYKWLIY